MAVKSEMCCDMTPSNIGFPTDDIVPDGFIESFVSDDSSYALESDFADTTVPLSLESTLEFLL